MTISHIFTAIIWGALSGTLAIHILANLLTLLFCLHGLLLTRWKRLAKKMLGLVKYSINLQLMLRISLYTLLFAGMLQFGDDFVRGQLRFSYRGNAAILFAAIALICALAWLPNVWRRLQVTWRMSHEVDFAERRQRTRMLSR